MKPLIIVIIVGLACVISVLVGSYRWRKKSDALREHLTASRVGAWPARYDLSHLAALPTPVRRFFSEALGGNHVMIQSVTLEQTGSFNMSGDGDNWKPFTAAQVISARRAGFDWHAKLSVLPFVKVHAHDALVAGEGIFTASLCGVFAVADLRGTEQLARDEFMRYIAETPWCPTALLPSRGVVWKAADDRSSYATFSDGDRNVTMLFRFNEQNLIESVRAESRGRTSRGKTEFFPWEGRWRGYVRVRGIAVPTDGEAVWILPDGERPYWRGHVTKIDIEFAE